MELIKFKDLLKKYNIKQYQLAYHLGITRQQFSKCMVDGRFSVKNAYEIAKTFRFEIWPDELIYTVDQIKEYRDV